MLIALLALPLVGCWDSNEIEKRPMVLAIGIDPAQQQVHPTLPGSVERNPTTYSGPIKLSAQIAITGQIPLGPPSGQPSTGTAPVYILSGTGRNFAEAIQDIQSKLPNEIYLGQLRVIAINEQIARQGILGVLDPLRRNREVSATNWMIITKQEAAQLIAAQPKGERVPALFVRDLLENAVKNGRLPPHFLEEFDVLVQSEGQEASLPYLQTDGNQISIAGLALFRSTQMVSTVDLQEMAAFSELYGLHPAGYPFNVPTISSQGVDTIQVQARYRKTKVILRNGQPVLQLHLRFDGRLQSKTAFAPQTTTKAYEKIQEEWANGSKASMEKLLRKTKAEKVDPFGFGETIRVQQPKLWEERFGSKARWEEAWPNMPVEISVETHLRRQGVVAQ
ncbi:MAG: Ger(x)C family spore germination protein [Firmicutes bacterium]|nr:Ger(x)C family spore germination protein [Bacillota bacterium]